MTEFIERSVSIGNAGRRLAAVDDASLREAFMRRVTPRLAELASADFYDNSEVLAAVARAG
jgi:hypothetical protein